MLLSLIVPTRNRVHSLSQLLDSLDQLEPAPFAWEILIIDNGSSDGTAEMVEQRAVNSPYAISYVVEEQPGLHRGRHRGAREAQGDILAYLDDDILFTPTWFQGALLIEDGTADVVAGRVLPRWAQTPPEWLLSLFDHGVCSSLSLLDLDESIQPISPEYVFGCNFLIRKRLVFEAGGFHPDGMPQELIRFRGDGETALMAKLHQRGYKLYYHPQALVYHVIGAERMTPEYICQRAYNQGISDSFSQIRAQHGLPGYSAPIPANRLRRLLTRSPAQIAATVARKARERVFSRSQPFDELHGEIDLAYQAGWAFHQRAVTEDPALLDYVLQPSFLDLDDAWEDRVS